MTRNKNHWGSCAGCTAAWRRMMGDPQKFTGKGTLVSLRERIKWMICSHVSTQFVSSRPANCLGKGGKNLIAKFQKHSSQMFVPRTYMSEDNHVMCDSSSCTEIVLSFHIAVVTNLWCLYTRRRIGKHPVDCLSVYFSLLINIVIHLGVINA